MAQGFLGGALWGTVCGVALLGVASQVVERRELSLPRPQAEAVEVPGGSEFDQARPETDPTVPGDVPRPAGEEVSTGVIPPLDAVDTPPSFDTSSLSMPQPSVEGPASLGEIPELSEDAEVTVTGPGPEEPSRDGAGQPALPAPESPGTAPSATTGGPEAIRAPAGEDAVPETSGDVIEEMPAQGDASATPAPRGEEDGEVVAEMPSAPAVDTASGGAMSAPEAGGDAAAPGLEVADEAPARTMPALPETDMQGAPVVDASDPEMSAPEVDEIPDVAEVEVEDDIDTPPVVVAELDTPVLSGIDRGEADVGAPRPEAEETVAAPTVIDVPDAQAQDAPPEAPEEMARVATLAPAEEIGDLATDVTTDRLPRIGDQVEDDAGLPVILPPPGTGEEETDEVAALDEEMSFGNNALRSNRVDFENAGDRPLLSVVLVHEGDAPIDPAMLAPLPNTVSFAVDAASPKATEIAAAYRAAGREVVLIPNLPQDARPQDVEVALSENFKRVPEAVALIDPTGEGFQANRNAVAQLVDIVEETGHGIITFPRGLNTAHQRAEQADVPAGLIFRDVDGGGESIDQIRRAFDRAAFRARQNDAVILVGRAVPSTMAAIVEWSLGSRASSVTLAPVSAALMDG